MRQLDSAQSAAYGYLPVAVPWPHDGAAVEWWFVHGNFSGEACLSGHFMLSIFRHDLDGAHSFSMLFRLEDSSGKAPYIVSRADGRLKDLLARSKEELHRTNLDKNLLKIYFEEVEKYGLPQSQSSTDGPVGFGDEDFSIVWADFSLIRRDDALVVEFRTPWADAATRFVMRSRMSEVNLSKLTTPGKEKMDYVTYPCCDLSGAYASEPVSGGAWFDHQWGDMSWFASEDASTGQKRLLGWDWFGINFQDGRAAVVLIHRDMETKEILTSNWAMIGIDGAEQIINDVQIDPLRFWYSPKTCILYPVEWNISIPSLGGELIFEPLSDDQEIPVAGATRAIWEGAGRVTGFLEGRPVSGTARLELNGYGYVFRLADVLEHFSRRILRHIQDFFPEVPDEQYFEKCTGFAPERGNVEAVRDFLTRPMWDLLARGGKYWRPMFGILMVEILGIDSTRYEELLSVSTELTHLASLVVDDIEDNALTRRKEACVHIKYGTDIAINAANTLYFLPILKLRENAFITDEQKLAIYTKTMEFFVKAHFGQGLDISRKASMSLAEGGDLTPLIRDSLNVYALKSAASVEFVTHTACIIADADQATAAALVAFARSFGVSFQIKDDVNDFGGAGVWTKEPGLDLACGKLTYVILLALEAATDDERAFLTRLLCKDIPCTAVNINRGMQIVRGSGALEKANANVLALLNDAWENLCLVVPQSDARIMLKVMCEHLLKLDYDSFDITA